MLPHLIFMLCNKRWYTNGWSAVADRKPPNGSELVLDFLSLFVTYL